MAVPPTAAARPAAAPFRATTWREARAARCCATPATSCAARPVAPSCRPRPHARPVRAIYARRQKAYDPLTLETCWPVSYKRPVIHINTQQPMNALCLNEHHPLVMRNNQRAGPPCAGTSSPSQVLQGIGPRASRVSAASKDGIARDGRGASHSVKATSYATNSRPALDTHSKLLRALSGAASGQVLCPSYIITGCCPLTPAVTGAK